MDSFNSFLDRNGGIVRTSVTTKDPKMTAAAEKQTPRSQPSAADRHATLVAANLKAKIQFADRYEGASIRLKTTLHNRPVIRSFKRIFNTGMRNWYIATSVPVSYTHLTLPTNREV